MVIIGIDAHKRSHTLVAVDGSGAKLGEKTVSTVTSGHTEGLRWATTRYGEDLLWAVEDSRVYTRLLEHDLMAAHQSVVRVPTTLMSNSRKSAREWGKSDPIDAAAVARAALREPDLPVAYHDDTTWDLKLLVERREDLVAQRVAVLNRLMMRLHLIDPGVPRPKNLNRAPGREALEDYLLTRPGSVCVRLAHEELRDIDHFSRNIDELTKNIGHRVKDLGSTLPDITGCGEITAAKFICEAANMTRFRSEAAFARYVGVAPIPGWSGATRGRLRLSHTGNRQLNSALHTIAIVQLRLGGPARAYYDRRIEAGDSKGGARRCLKRKICRIVYGRLQADYRRRQEVSQHKEGLRP